MSENTKIEWATHTFNPWEGCQKVGPGCDHCYAETRNARFAGGTAINWGPGSPRRRTSAANWAKPLAWNANHDAYFAEHGHRQRVFCASLADVFDNAVDPQWRVDLFNLILSTPNLDWLLLTKRIGNAAQMINDTLPDNMKALPPDCPVAWPWPNVWIGATIVSQEEADRDIPKLLAVPAAKRFLSMEPLLGQVNLRHLNEGWEYNEINCLKPYTWDQEVAAWRDTEDDWKDSFEDEFGKQPDGLTGPMHPGIDWVIVGGESGPGARPMHPDWARSLREQCEAAGVPFLFKQWGEWKPISQMEETEYGGVYRSRVIATPHQDQRNLDDIYGRRCTVPTSVLHVDGSMHDITEPMAFLQGTEAMQIFRLGKKAAGRLLDGRTWDGLPS